MRSFFGSGSKERPQPLGVEIQSQRLEGQNFAQALTRWAGANNLNISQIPQGREDLLFERIYGFEIPPDLNHALALGQDGRRISLLKDGQVILEDFSSVWAKTLDFSRLIVRDPNFNVYLIDENGVKIKLLERGKGGQFLFGTDSLEAFWLSHTLEEKLAKKTFFQRFDSEGRVAQSFEVGMAFIPQVVRVSADLEKIAWIGKRWELGGGGWVSYLWLNDKLLEKGRFVSCLASPDFSKILTVVSKDRGSSYQRKIKLNGQTIHEGKFDIGQVINNQDLSLVAFRLWKDPETSRFFYLINDSSGLTDPFEELLSLEIKDNQQIQAVVCQNGVRRLLTISKPNQLTPAAGQVSVLP